MRALVTGASSGIGRDIARELAARGIDLVLVARRKERLEELAEELAVETILMPCDLSREEECYRLFEACSEMEIDILVNNAGFGQFGTFTENDMARELSMLDVNVRALQILMKLFLRKWKGQQEKYILNVASSAAFQPGPMLAAYYATKAYVLRLSEAVYEELRREGRGVSLSILCPGPVRTEFDEAAEVHFSVKGLSSAFVARCAVQKMFAKKLVIVPGFLMKCAHFFGRFLPDKQMLRVAYHMQKRKL